MSHMLSWIIFGLIVGGIAKLMMPGKDPGGLFVTMCLGIAGSFLGGFLASAVGWYGPGRQAGFVLSIAGAILLLWIYRQLQNQGTSNL